MVAPFIFALGDAPSVSLPAAATVNIAPPDDSVDSNRVIITGRGTISSFGLAAGGLTRWQYDPDPEDVACTDDVITLTKQIDFQPDPGQSITLQNNPPALTLLGGVNRTITKQAFGTYQSDTNGNWTETQFSQSDLDPTNSGGLLSFVVYNSSQTITIPPYATRAWVRMWGACGATGSGYAASGGPGTGSGGWLEKYLTGLAPGKTLIFTRGAGGTPFPSGGGGFYGGDGTATTLASGTQTIGTLTANSSKGTGSVNNPSAGGSASGGDINLTGQSGGGPYTGQVPDGSGGYTSGILPGVGGTMLHAHGLDGSAILAGNNGLPGGMIIAWFR